MIHERQIIKLATESGWIYEKLQIIVIHSLPQHETEEKYTSPTRLPLGQCLLRPSAAPQFADAALACGIVHPSLIVHPKRRGHYRKGRSEEELVGRHCWHP